jgi:hypothetical protein
MVAWCYDGPHQLVGLYPDSRFIQRLDLQSGRSSRDEFTNSLQLVPTFESGNYGTSRCNIRVSPDGSQAAISAGSNQFANEDENQTATYLISRKKKHAKYLLFGSPIAWLDSRRILIWRDNKSSGDLFIVDVNGKVVATRHMIAMATVSSAGDIYAVPKAYFNLDSFLKFVRLDSDLQNSSSGHPGIPVHGADWRGHQNDAVAALQP